MSGLVVNITPSQSAFFAGEIFTATITISNPAPPVDPPSQHSALSLSAVQPPRTAGPLGRPPHPRDANNQRQRPPSASHLGLAEYATSHLDSDEVPPSPFLGSGFRSDLPPQPLSGSTTSYRETTVSTSSGGALPTPKSATFGPRSISGSAGSLVASTSRSGIPGRKGLIGKPIPKPVPTLERRLSGGPPNGLYAGGPRRPGEGGAKGHGRSQSMAVSSPDLLESAPNGSNLKIHGRSRLGGSMSVESVGVLDDRQRSGTSGRIPPAIEEEASSPSFDSAPSLPLSNTSTPSTSAASLFSPPGPAAPNPNSPYGQRPSDDPTGRSSTFSLGDGADGSDYDPTDSTNALPTSGFYGVGQNDTMESIAREGLEDWTHRTTTQGAPTLHGSYSAGPTVSTFGARRSASEPMGGAGRNAFLHPPNTISILWSFAHLEGTFEVEESLIKPAEFVEVKRALLGGAGTGMGMGGGTLEENPGGGGWRNWLFGGEQGRGLGASWEERKRYTMKEKTVPTFSSPPSILGIDLVLEPGQTKSYTFSIRVPADLPPSFRGKAIKFSYHLVVGTNRVSVGPSAGSGGGRPRSRVMRVPVRMYNHVGITGARPFYDLTNPIVYHRDEATTNDVDDPKVAKRVRRPSAGRAEFEEYAAALLNSVPDGNGFSADILTSPNLHPSPPLMESVPAMRPEMRPQMDNLNLILPNEDEEGVGCKAAVEIVSRNSQKVSYDINKDGYMVASLTLVKSAYRLGETVNGSVVINSGEGRVLRVSARLETHELIETTIATRTAPQVRQITRRLHAEHHEMTLDSARIGFALAIPSGATPDFATSGVKLQWSVRLSFLVIPPSPDSPFEKPPQRMRSGRSAPPPPAPSPARHGRSKSFAYGFEPAVSLTLPAAPMIQPTGATHLMPVVGPLDSSPAHTSYRGVPDLGYVPVLFSSAAPEPPPSPGPLQRTAAGAGHRSTASLSGVPRQLAQSQRTNVVLVPAKVETVECSIPIKVYPGNTPFRPTISCFDDTR